jgi:hypothetical protein
MPAYLAADLGGNSGIHTSGSSQVTLKNTIVAENTSNDGADLSGAFISGGHNLIGIVDGSTGFSNGVNGDKAGTAVTPLDAQLDPPGLQDNGGPTPTIALLCGSPAIDAGDNSVTNPPDNLTTDQRGFPRRFNNTVDIGAFEVQSLTGCPTIVTTVAAPTSCVGSTVCKVVTFATPVIPIGNDCSGVVSCSPPSGTCFPAGTSTVTCVSTIGSGASASCAFPVTVLDVCLQDGANPRLVILVDTSTGNYQLCVNGTTLTGRGRITRAGCTVTLEHNAADRRVLARIDRATFRGTAAFQLLSTATGGTITDRDTRNNTCSCQ